MTALLSLPFEHPFLPEHPPSRLSSPVLFAFLQDSHAVYPPHFRLQDSAPPVLRCFQIPALFLFLVIRMLYKVFVFIDWLHSFEMLNGANSYDKINCCFISFCKKKNCINISFIVFDKISYKFRGA